MKFIYSVLVLAVGSVCFGQVRQTTLPPLPGFGSEPNRNTTLVVCECPRTGVCVCTPFCVCGEAGFAAVYRKAERDGIPLVIFAGVSRRDVSGLASIGQKQWCSRATCYANNVVIAFPWDKRHGPDTFHFVVLPGDATDSQILAASVQREQPQVAVAAPRPVVQKARPLRSGEHVHRCGVCGTEWQHTDASKGIRAEHICPNCGAGPWWQPVRRGVNEPASYPAMTYNAPRMPFAFGSFCPT